ncbi:SRPBCC family protein [Terrabacter tumescens]|uniref:SRPBCC family protein n=1 Tax=Terrabacter tumescens TaxID=60443 RepID=UPI0006932B5E|nr:SRPBCC domain-containing protein [Terrabacter tumescens]
MTAQHRKLVLEQARVFEAATEHVFGLFTVPTELAKWWGPHGFATPEIQVDLRVGGSLRFTMQPPEGAAFHLSGEFLEIRPPSELRFTFRWDEPVADDRETVAAVSLEPLGGRTSVTLVQGDFATEERLELHRRGWADSFERLDAVLRSRRD